MRPRLIALQGTGQAFATVTNWRSMYLAADRRRADCAHPVRQREIYGTNEFAHLQVELRLSAKGPYSWLPGPRPHWMVYPERQLACLTIAYCPMRRSRSDTRQDCSRSACWPRGPQS